MARPLLFVRGLWPEPNPKKICVSPASWHKPPPDAGAELEAILRELYAALSRYRLALALVRNSAAHWPELGELFYGGVRRALIRRLERYLQTPDRGREFVCCTRCGDRRAADLGDPRLVHPAHFLVRGNKG